MKRISDVLSLGSFCYMLCPSLCITCTRGMFVLPMVLVLYRINLVASKAVSRKGAFDHIKIQFENISHCDTSNPGDYHHYGE